MDRMKREFNVEANVGKPQVAYRETIRASAEDEETHKKQTGGRGQYGHVKLRIEPAPAKGSNSRTTLSAEDSEGVHSGGREGNRGGARGRHSGGLPDVGHQGCAVRRQLSRGRLVGDGVQNRGFYCVKEAVEKAKPVLLEPVMRVEVTVPEEYMGPVTAILFDAADGWKALEIAGGRTLSRRWCRFRKCSATRPICAHARRAAAASRCTLASMRKFRRTWPRKLSIATGEGQWLLR